MPLGRNFDSIQSLLKFPPGSGRFLEFVPLVGGWGCAFKGNNQLYIIQTLWAQVTSLISGGLSHLGLFE